MKAELIADWRLRIADRTLITLPVSAIDRVLEERDALLAALRETYDACNGAEWCQECAIGREEQAHMIKARAAIAYAGSE